MNVQERREQVLRAEEAILALEQKSKRYGEAAAAIISIQTAFTASHSELVQAKSELTGIRSEVAETVEDFRGLRSEVCAKLDLLPDIRKTIGAAKADLVTEFSNGATHAITRLDYVTNELTLLDKKLDSLLNQVSSFEKNMTASNGDLVQSITEKTKILEQNITDLSGKSQEQFNSVNTEIAKAGQYSHSAFIVSVVSLIVILIAAAVLHFR